MIVTHQCDAHGALLTIAFGTSSKKGVSKSPRVKWTKGPSVYISNKTREGVHAASCCWMRAAKMRPCSSIVLTSPARHRVVVLRLRVCYMLTAPLLSLVCRLARWRPCSDDWGHSICWEGKSNGHRQQVQTTRRQCLLWFFKSDPTRKHFLCKPRSLRV